MAKRRPSARTTSAPSTGRRPTARSTSVTVQPGSFGLDLPGGEVPPTIPGHQTTGRKIVTFRDGSKPAMKSMMQKLQDRVGIRAAVSSDFAASAPNMTEAMSDGALVLEEIGIMIVDADSDQLSSMSTMMSEDDGMIVEPEYINFALGLDLPHANEFAAAPTGAGLSLEFLRGYRAAIDAAIEMMSQGTEAASVAAAAMPQGSAQATWGLMATGAQGSRFNGAGIKIAVLDTGFDLNHPDFKGRSITSQSFISGQTVQDGNGHGTHCIGTACGPRNPTTGPRYGVATQAEIFAGKVLSDQGSGSDGGIMAGINWAISQGCRIVSMSLGRPTFVGEPPSQAYEMLASRALKAGTLIIAAAGNESRRPFDIRPVGSPANSPSIVAVGAVNSSLQMASFSCRGLNGSGGEVNFAGPGVDVYSSWPLPRQYNTISGTSMATPHVAGIAALYLQADPGLDAIGLYRAIAGRCRRLSLPTNDIGWGLIQAP